jgi:hypothetical protein
MYSIQEHPYYKALETKAPVFQPRCTTHVYTQSEASDIAYYTQLLLFESCKPTLMDECAREIALPKSMVNHCIFKEWQIALFSASYLLISYKHKTIKKAKFVWYSQTQL